MENLQQGSKGIVVLFGGIKGGPGKTTVAYNMAVQHKAAGNNVTAVDADDTTNLNGWGTSREITRESDAVYSDIPEIVVVQKTGKAVGKAVRKLADQLGDVIVDAGGLDSDELRAVALIADKWVCPIVASQFSIDTFGRLAEVARNANVMREQFDIDPIKIHLVINFAHPGPKSLNASKKKEVTDILEQAMQHEKNKDFGSIFTVLDSVINYRRVHQRECEGRGIGIGELKTSNQSALKGREEFQDLYREVFQ
ncbi:division plane positioning ATPase MipZ [Aestuariispira insulae]|uniref:Chromosome partitioning protein n=1 Tax=Aestuariispira insulae TaxID=1461337 RepID=A0A3D9H590_9PROT|nr:division plane positioning ATPase MipZ [Aestuariispira insulae]RED44106.1 chromosome partitioning protein [Aestuariispira insulae]